jgi:hypothetical protein
MDIVNAFLFGLPSPPVPLLVIRNNEEGYGNSHQLIRQATLHAIARKDENANKERKIAQLPITLDLVRVMRTETDPEKIYDACCRFTCAILQSYTPNMTLDVRFPPFHFIHNDTNTSVVNETREHLAAMKLFDLNGGDFLQYKKELEGLPYSILLKKYTESHKERQKAGTEYVGI